MSTASFPPIGKNQSSYPGMTFDPFDSMLTKGIKSDPMLQGINLDYYHNIEEHIRFLIKEKKVPKSYSIHNEIHLEKGRPFDTTNQNIVMWSEKDHFDPDGFKTGHPLEKDIFYRDPYITCTHCNSINFVDSMAVRRHLHFPRDVLQQLPKEPLPKCTRCQRTDGFIVGAHDLADDIEQRKKNNLERYRRENRAAKTIQRAFRLHLRVMYGRSYLLANFAHRTLLFNAASQIAGLVRGRLARRQAATERCLRVIRRAHPLLIRHALRSSTPMRVFWYRKVDEEILYQNYLELVERTGFSPARLLVERNIAEIARRIIERQQRLATTIQKQWRGFMARRMVRLYRYEIIRLRQIAAAKVMRVQRTFRGHMIRLRLLKAQVVDKRRLIMQTYQNERRLAMERASRQLGNIKILNHYRKERGEERMARSMSRIDDASRHGDRRLRAYAKSCYADDRVHEAIIAKVKSDLSAVRKLRNAIKNEANRKQFILDRLREEESPVYGITAPELHIETGTVSPLTTSASHPNQSQHSKSSSNLLSSSSSKGLSSPRKELISVESSSVMNTKMTLSSNPLVELGIKNKNKHSGPMTPRRAQKLKTYFKEELSDIMNNVIDRMTHDFSHKDLHHRLKQHNVLKKTVLGEKNKFKFPKGINERPMDWLFEDNDNDIDDFV